MARSFTFVQKPLEAEVILKEQMAEIERLVKPVATSHLKKRRAVVKNWKNKPTFKSKIGIGPAYWLRLTVEVGNANKKVVPRRGGRRRRGGKRLTIGQLWRGHDQTGFRPHKIRPRGRGYPLRFRAGAGRRPRTSVGTLKTQTPRQGKDWRSTYEVNHPGSKPRGWTDIINEEENDALEVAIDEGMIRGFEKAKRGRRRGRR